MSSIALYRKYRPSDIKDLIGQDHVVQSLENALSRKRISHAYLFSGPRGVGKTSTARILAARVNGLRPDQAVGHLDIIEIDAASNRRIDEIRDLREKVHLAPAQGKYKVYIIDEVHMLTAEAFNALLKTLEEPPSHVIFILATTEPHKLPATIISRTQRYSFRPAELATLVKHLTKIAKAEKISIEEAALEIIASSAEGSIRDSISILDQAANLSSGKITAAEVNQLLGLGEQAAVEKLARALVATAPRQTLDIFDSYKSGGGGSAQLLGQLLRLFERVMRVQLELVKPESKAQSWLANSLKPAQSMRIVKRLIDVPQNSPYLEIALEAALVQIASSAAVPAEPVSVPGPAAEAKPVTVGRPAAKAQPSPPKPKVATGDFTSNVWPKALTLVKKHNNSLYALLRAANASIDHDNVLVSFRFQFHRRRLDEAKNTELLGKILSQLLGKPVVVKTAVLKAIEPTEATNQPEAEQDREAIKNVLQILGGEVVGG